MKHTSFLLVLLTAAATSHAYDEYSSSCMRPGGRTAKAWPEPPCDFKTQGWCTAPGSAYPWHAVRRFVHENQGLMRRMYGDMRQISVLRAEYESNDVLYPGDGADFQLIRDGVTKRYRPSVTESSPVVVTSNRRISSSTSRPRSTTASSTTTTTSTTTARSTSTTTSVPQNATELMTELQTEDTTPVTTMTPGDTTVAPEERETTTIEEEEELLDDQVAAESEVEYEEEDVVDEVIEPADGEQKQQQQPPQMLRRGINACPVKEEVVAPFWANNTRGEVLALLNLYPFEQYVHWEKCTDEHQQMFCRDGCRCEQQYRLHRLLAYDPRNECRGIFSDWFKFPSCCVCKCYDIPPEFRLTSRSPRRGTSKSKKVGVKSKLERTEEMIAAATSAATAEPVKEPEVPINGMEPHDGEIRADLQAVVHHSQPQYRHGARSFPEAATIGPVDAATPHFYYQPLMPLSRRPREA